MSGRRRQELHCHACDRFVQFVVDLDLNGNHVLNCPNCGHEHCRVVRDGVITDIRWDSRNGPTWPVYLVRSTVTATMVSQNTYNAFYSSSSTATNNIMWVQS